MKQMIRFLLALGSLLLAFTAQATSIPNTNDPTTFLGPTLKGRYTSPLTENTAFSVLGEVGNRNLRIGGTVGLRLDSMQRLKFSIEGLRQQITYAFFSGNSRQWVNQLAIGGAYQYDLSWAYDPAFDLSAYYSHAPNHNLHTVTGTFVNSGGNTQNFSDYRRIAGSNAAGIAPGLSFTPWMGSRAGVEVNYDHVVYDNKFISDRKATGLGGSAHLFQVLTEDLGLGLAAAWRQPFNNYTARLAWTNFPYIPHHGGTWIVAIDGAYTVGKESLPDTWNASLNFDYMLDPAPVVAPDNFLGKMMPPPVNDHFKAWAIHPAIYMPQVLAIVDQRVEISNPPSSPPSICNAPQVIAGLPLQQIDTTGTIATAQLFSGDSPLSFSVTTNANPANSVTINSATGVVTVNGTLQETFIVNVTASNRCGSATTSFEVEILD